MNRTAKGIVLVLAIVGVVAMATVYRNIRLDRGLSAFKAEHHAAAYAELRPLAMLGDPEAQRVLGLMTAYGWGVPRDQEGAIEWLSRAGGPIAPYAYDIADSYAEGIGSIPKDESLAASWFKIAGEAGSKEAARRLAEAFSKGELGLPRDSEQAAYWRSRSN